MKFTIIIESHTGKCGGDVGCNGHLMQVNTNLLGWEANDWRERFFAKTHEYEWHERIIRMVCTDETGLILWQEDRMLDHLFDDSFPE